MNKVNDIFTEPSGVDVDTLKNLGPLTGMAGIWRGKSGVDTHLESEGPEVQQYIERMELQPIDPQTNGPQLLYGLRYHTHITKPGEVETFHDQVGYWLWEPATGTIMHTLAIPRGMVAMAMGTADSNAKSFELVAKLGSNLNGICSNPFLDKAFKTEEFHIKVTINSDGSWTYDEDTIMSVHGKDEPFHHTDTHTLRKIGEPTPNPLAQV